MKVQNNNSIFTSSMTWRTFLTTIPAMALLLAGTTIGPRADASDINVHPSNCVAPLLNQAFPMRWHEWYLMNPASNQATFVLCPMPYDGEVVPIVGQVAVITGSRMSGASNEPPLCFFTVVDRLNADLGEFGNLGNKRAFTVAMQTQEAFPLWAAVSPQISAAALASAGVSGNPKDWSVATFCNMSPGFAITQILLQD